MQTYYKDMGEFWQSLETFMVREMANSETPYLLSFSASSWETQLFSPDLWFFFNSSNVSIEV